MSPQAMLDAFDPSAETNLKRKIDGLLNEQAREQSRIAEERKQNKEYVISCDAEARKIRTEALEAEKRRLADLKRKLQVRPHAYAHARKQRADSPVRAQQPG